MALSKPMTKLPNFICRVIIDLIFFNFGICYFIRNFVDKKDSSFVNAGWYIVRAGHKHVNCTNLAEAV